MLSIKPKKKRKEIIKIWSAYQISQKKKNNQKTNETNCPTIQQNKNNTKNQNKHKPIHV